MSQFSGPGGAAALNATSSSGVVTATGVFGGSSSFYASGQAHSALGYQFLKNRLAAEEIAGGHAFDKHVLSQGEFPGSIRTRVQFQQHIESVMNNPTAARELSRGRIGYWHDESGTAVIRNPFAADGGTTFRPANGVDYFNGLK